MCLRVSRAQVCYYCHLVSNSCTAQSSVVGRHLGLLPEVGAKAAPTPGPSWYTKRALFSWQCLRQPGCSRTPSRSKAGMLVRVSVPFHQHTLACHSHRPPGCRASHSRPYTGTTKRCSRLVPLSPAPVGGRPALGVVRDHRVGSTAGAPRGGWSGPEPARTGQGLQGPVRTGQIFCV